MFLTRTLALASALGLVAGVCAASDNYPFEIQKKLGIDQPDCTLCHRDDKGGTGTVVTLFGVSLEGFGAVGKNPSSLDNALDEDAASNCDSDGDGVPDIAELMAGTDPSDGPGGVCGAPAPKHGCDASIAGRAPGGRWAAHAVLLVAGLFVFRRARRRRRGTA